MMMNLKASISFLALAFSLNAFSLPLGLKFHQDSFKVQKLSSPSMEVSFYDQKLNHAYQSSTTFKQRYFVDSQYAENSSSPVFYIICGEWNCGGTNSYGYAVNLAKKVKAHLVALEHRYYGKSFPTSYLSTANLRHLNLASAIEDLAQFQKFMMKENKLTGKWIAFGGSYAGTLSAFYRLKYPTLVSGALASSAPVYMKPEFYEYDAHIAKVVNRSSCGDNVRRAVDLIEEKMKTQKGAKELKTLFRATDIRLNEDFMYVVADMLAAAVQYGFDKQFCKSLASHQDIVAGYAQGGLQALTALGLTPARISMQAAETLHASANTYFRQWMWQSCSEFGWFQIANGNSRNSARSEQVNLKYHTEVCLRLFQTEMTASSTMNAHWYNHLFSPQTEKIIFTNGTKDPWLTLSVTEYLPYSNPELPLFMMANAAHVNDLAGEPNLASVIQTQIQMDKIVAGWLEN